VDRSLRDAEALAGHYGGRVDLFDSDELWVAWNQVLRPRDVALRASVPPAGVASAVATLDRRLAGAGFLLSATVSAGIIRCIMRPAPGSATLAAIEAARAVIERHGGTMQVEHAPPSIKRGLDVWGPPRDDFAIMRRIKEEFDPRGTLAPGRFVGRL
jgi:glycolate oxidase FAD binding subunit